MKKRLLMIMCFMFAIVFFIGNIYAEEDYFELAYRKNFELTNEEYECGVGFSIAYSKDGGIVISSKVHNPIVVKYDKDGIEEWKLKDFATENDVFHNESSRINFKHTEIGYILVSNSNIYFISEDGKLIKKYFESNEIVEFDLESIDESNFIINDDGVITIINTSNGLDQLQYYNPNGELTYTKDLNESIDLNGNSSCYNQPPK